MGADTYGHTQVLFMVDLFFQRRGAANARLRALHCQSWQLLLLRLRGWHGTSYNGPSYVLIAEVQKIIDVEHVRHTFLLFLFLSFASLARSLKNNLPLNTKTITQNLPYSRLTAQPSSSSSPPSQRTFRHPFLPSMPLLYRVNLSSPRYTRSTNKTSSPSFLCLSTPGVHPGNAKK